jgi:hypothetical protein
MTHYFITAWCERPFYAQCEVEADTPQEAIARARALNPDEPAEECIDDYIWDEWRVDTAETEGVLRQLDGLARLRASAIILLDACRMVVERWDQGDLAEAARACQAAIEEASGAASTGPAAQS